MPEENPIVTENLLIIKCRFKSSSSNLFGQFMILFNNYKKIDSCSAVVSTYSNVFDIEPHTNWDKFEESIADLKWKGNFNTNMTNALVNEFTKIANDPGLSKIIHDSAINYDYKNLEITLFDAINIIFHDKNMVIETGIQEVSLQELRQVREDRNKPKEPAAPSQQDTFKAPEGTVILPIKAMLAPVNGKPIYELKVGDRLMVKIEPNTDRAKYFIDLLDLWDDGNSVKPTPVEVIDIKSGQGKNDPIEILTEIGTGVYGKITEDQKQVKLRIYNPDIDGNLIKKKIIKKQAKEESLSPYPEQNKSTSTGIALMLILFLVIAGLFLILMLINW